MILITEIADSGEFDLKERVKTGAILTAVVILIITAGKLFPRFCIYDVAFGAIAAIGIIEMFRNTGFIKSKCVTAAGIIYTVFVVFSFGQFREYIAPYRDSAAAALAVFLFFYCMLDRKHSSAVEPMIAFSMSMVLGYAFGSVLGLLISDAEKGILHFVLLLVFSWVTDIGAYLVGKTLGKHKLCPDLSPKKTVEGAVGGVVFCIVITVLFCIAFDLISNNYKTNLLALALLAIPLSIVVML